MVYSYGIYKDAQNKKQLQLQKSIVSHMGQVKEHENKIQNPEKYAADWSIRSTQAKNGLLRKWQKDMIRNATQAAIEIRVLEDRFGK